MGEPGSSRGGKNVGGQTFISKVWGNKNGDVDFLTNTSEVETDMTERGFRSRSRGGKNLKSNTQRRMRKYIKGKKRAKESSGTKLERGNLSCW